MNKNWMGKCVFKNELAGGKEILRYVAVEQAGIMYDRIARGVLFVFFFLLLWGRFTLPRDETRH